jgi:hypothetical protein
MWILKISFLAYFQMFVCNNKKFANLQQILWTYLIHVLRLRKVLLQPLLVDFWTHWLSFPKPTFLHFYKFRQKFIKHIFWPIRMCQNNFFCRNDFFQLFVVILYALVNSLKWPDHHSMVVQRWALLHFRVWNIWKAV